MQMFSQLTDDQIALIGCAVALLATGTLMSLSYYVGQARRQRSDVVSRSITPTTEHSNPGDRKAA